MTIFSKTPSSWWLMNHPFEKNMCKSNWIQFPQLFGMNFKKCLSCHHLDIDVSKNRGTPKSSIFNRVFHYKPSFWGYPYFWKHPHPRYQVFWGLPVCPPIFVWYTEPTPLPSFQKSWNNGGLGMNKLTYSQQKTWNIWNFNTRFSSWWFQPIWKICSSKWIISPSRGENKKYLKPPPSFSWFFPIYSMDKHG